MVMSLASGRVNNARKYFSAFVCSWALVSVATSFDNINAVESSAACMAALTELAWLKSTAKPTAPRIGKVESAKVMATLPLRARANAATARRTFFQAVSMAVTESG